MDPTLDALLRLSKFGGLVLLGAGAAGAFGTGALPERQRAVYRLFTAGFLLTWLGGWAMARARGVPLSTPWVLGAMAGSLVSFQAVVWVVEAEARPQRGAAAVAAAGLLGAVALMVWRPGGVG
jgi:hypothetical protein